ncbi:MAG: glycosyltransferase [Thermoflexales bacterium]|nr:glycosyltransferase [Thermoflexales bacterium]
MRIGIDLRPLQTQDSRNRGIGRYVHNHVQALLSMAQEDEFLLFYTANLETPTLLENTPSGTHWRAIPLETPTDACIVAGQTLSPDEDIRQASVLQAAVSNYKLDVFHVTSLFEREIAFGQGFGICRTVVTLYDLVPLVFAPIYLWPASPDWRALYLHRLKLLARADRIMAISAASKRDAKELLGLPSDRLDVILAGVEDCFKLLADRTLIETTRLKFDLPKRYILSVLGYHYTKNLEGAIAAYSHLPTTLRGEVPLVIVCRLLEVERQAIRELIESYGVKQQVVLAGEVKQDELVALYNGASVFFYPSRYDGFGLPVLEAMRCGTPVVTSTRSSLPEVAGEAALLADPEDHADLAAKLDSVLTDAELSRQLREKGLAQAQRFSWQNVAKKTLRLYRQTLSPSAPLVHISHPRLKIAYWSPLNPCQSGISDYSEHLLPHLGQYADIDIFVDGYAPVTDAITDQFRVYDYRAYPALASQRSYDINLYQMGNSLFHEYMYNALCTEPGVVVLHDYVLQGFTYATTEARGQREHYLDEIEYSEGGAARKAVERELAAGKINPYAYPLNRRVVEASQGLIVHSQWARLELEKRAARNPITVIPHGVRVFPVNPTQRARLRSKLGLAVQDLVIGCFGRIVATKRVGSVIRAFNRLCMVYPHAALVFVGKPEDDGMAAWIKSLLSRYALEKRVRVSGYVTEELFNSYLQVSDICVNLRYPSAGETSGTLCRALGAGVPALASNLEQFAEFPNECVWTVDTDDREEDELVAYLLELAFKPAVRRQMGRNGQDYITQHATWPRVAAQYAGFIKHILGLSQGFVAG